MALQLIVDSLDSVPESVREMYAEADGKFRLQVDGIEDTKGLKSTLEKYKVEAKANAVRLQEFEARYQGIDPDQVKSLMAKFESKEEAELIAAGKMDQVIELRTEKQRAEFMRQVKDSQTKAEQADERASKFSQRVLDNHIRAAAAKVGIHSQAIEDALFRGRNLFKLDENGDAVQLGMDGHPVFGKDGKTPFTPMEWLEGMKEKAPHWFPAGATGGGSGGDRGGSGGTKTITRQQYEAMTPIAQRESFKAGIKVVDK